MRDGITRRRRIRLERLRWTRGWLLLVLLSLLGMMVLYSMLREHTGLLGFGLAGVLLSSFHALDRSRRDWMLALALAVPHVLLIALHDPATDPVTLRVLGQVFGILFYGFVAYIILAHVISARVVVADTLYGAASVYLLLALVWALGFAVLDALQPGAFTASGAALVWDDFVYFSVATLTTLGYGDILPVTPAARSLVMLEVVVGVFYTTVVLARLVGLYIAQATVPPSED